MHLLSFWMIVHLFLCTLLPNEGVASTTRRRRRSYLDVGTAKSLPVGVDMEADFVIVGAGTAGSLVAERLSKVGSVLIVECGAELPHSVRSRIPGAGCTYDQFEGDTEEDLRLCGKRCRKEMRRSKGFRDTAGLNFREGPGGTSVLAVGAHFRGGDSYWNELAKSHGDHWLLPERDILKLEHEMSVRAVPVAVDEDHLLFAQVLSGHLSQAGQSPSLTGRDYTFQRYQDDSGWSVNSYTQFLKKAIERENVQMLTNACARRLIKADGRSAPVVEVRRKSGKFHVRARREVILAAGVLGSSALLQRSGVPTTHVRDQADVRIAWPCSHCRYSSDFVKALHSFFSKRNATSPPGALTLPGFDSGALVDLGGAPALIMASTERGTQRSQKGSLLEVHIVLLQPRSFEGSVTILGKLRLSNRLTDLKDLDAAIQGIQLVRRVVEEHAALEQLGLGQEIVPGVKYQTVTDLRRFLRSTNSGAVTPFQSATSSCRLGQVVDSQMRVIGMPNVRVADASVLPKPPLGRTLFPTLIVAEVASRLIKNTTC